jgi:OFA family oxalate/formate antiporter-like MFS transporter
MGYATSLPMLYVLYCAAGMGAAFVYSGSIGSALKWFKTRRGLASGIMAAGFGGGTALFIPIISWIIASRGYQSAFIATGILQGLVIVIVAQFLRHPPPEPASVVATPAAGAGSQIGKRQFTTLEMLQTPQFYVMYLAFLLMATGGLLVTANAGPMARSWGLTAAALTLATTLGPLANGASRVFWGWASDRLGRENTMVLTFVLQCSLWSRFCIFFCHEHLESPNMTKIGTHLAHQSIFDVKKFQFFLLFFLILLFIHALFTMWSKLG